MESRNQWIPLRKAAGGEVKFLKFEGRQITAFILSLALGFLLFLALDALGVTAPPALFVAGLPPVSTALFLMMFVHRKPRQYFRHWWEWKRYLAGPEKRHFMEPDSLERKERK